MITNNLSPLMQAAVGGEEEAGREKRESVSNKKKVIETSRRLGTILSKKK